MCASRSLTWHLVQKRKGATLACVSKCPGHRLIQIRDSGSISRRKGERVKGKKGRDGTKEGWNERRKAEREAVRQKVERNDSPERKAGTLRNGRKQTRASPLGNVGVLQAVFTNGD